MWVEDLWRELGASPTPPLGDGLVVGVASSFLAPFLANHLPPSCSDPAHGFRKEGREREAQGKYLGHGYNYKSYLCPFRCAEGMFGLGFDALIKVFNSS